MTTEWERVPVYTGNPEPYKPEVSALVKERTGQDNSIRPVHADLDKPDLFNIAVTFHAIPDGLVPIFYTDPKQTDPIQPRMLLTIIPSGEFQVVLKCTRTELSDNEYLATQAIKALYLAYPQLKGEATE